jgi:hypothetical protein
MLPGGKHINEPKPFTPPSAKWLADLGKRVAKLEKMGAAAPITIHQTPGGPVLGFSGSNAVTAPAITSGSIPARTGKTPGKGKVFLETYDGSSNVKDATMTTDVLNNYTGTTGVAPDNTTCTVGRDAQGNWWIIGWSCAT